MSSPFLNRAVTQPKGEPERAPVELLDVNQVAEMLHIASRTVYRLAEQGQIPGPIRLGRLVRWRRESLYDWMAQAEHAARAGAA